MSIQSLTSKLLVSALAALPLVSGCSGDPPYVLDREEFNRESVTFATGIADRDSVTVCYAKNAATPQAVTRLAVAECSRFGRRAVFREQSYMECPLLTPVAAIYDCVGAKSRTY